MPGNLEGRNILPSQRAQTNYIHEMTYSAHLASEPTTTCAEPPPTTMTLAMPSLLLIMFILQLFLHIINTVGATTIDELVRVLPPKTLRESPSQRVLERACANLGHIVMDNLQHTSHAHIVLPQEGHCAQKGSHPLETRAQGCIRTRRLCEMGEA